LLKFRRIVPLYGSITIPTSLQFSLFVKSMT
jgi:hypothetical protein